MGSSYFREDLGRLAVCKQWFACARAVYFRDLALSPKALRRLLSSPEVGQSLILAKANLKSLNLNLKGFEDWNVIPMRQGSAPDADALDASSWDSHLGRAVLEAWTTVLDEDLTRLASIVKDSRKLQVIRIQASSEHHPMLPSLPRRDYLSIPTIRALLSAKNLTVLELDTCGTRLIPRQGCNDFHICEIIGELLATLRRLRLRMRSICADVLRPQNNIINLHLTEVLINLSLSNESPTITSATHSLRCGSTAGGLLGLKADIEEQAQALAVHMAYPRIIRILTHSLPQLEMQSLDVLTGRRMILADGMAWENDGKNVEVLDSESDAQDDSFSTSSDE